MGTFDYDSFANLTHVFDLKKGQVVPPQPKARIILYSSTILKSRNLQSKFFDPKIFIPEAKQPFCIVAAPKTKPTPTARPILRLKTKVEVAPLTPLTRRSTKEDLAAAFRAEMAMMQKKAKKAPETGKSGLEEAFTHRHRHPLSHKPWSELLADAEKPAKRENFDMAAAFKAEMKAFMSEQAKIGALAASETPVPQPVKFKAAPERKTVISTQPRRQRYTQMRQSLAA